MASDKYEYGVFAWQREQPYRREKALKVYKLRHAAERFADAKNDEPNLPRGGYVVREVEMRMAIKIPAELKAARESLGFTQNRLAEALGMSSKNGGRHIRKLEAGTYPISGQIAVAVELLLQHQKDHENEN